MRSCYTVSKTNDIKNMKREQKMVSPARVLSEDIDKKIEIKEENNVSSFILNEQKIERKRVSFDLRTDLHRQLKMQAAFREKNIYEMIEEALVSYFENEEK